MGTSQPVSRGFHRLGIFLATIVMLALSLVMLFLTLDTAESERRSHAEQAALVCAKTQLAAMPKNPNLSQENYFARFHKNEPNGVAQKKRYTTQELFGGNVKPWDRDWGSRKPSSPEAVTVPKHDLKNLGCSEESKTVSERDILDAIPPPEFNYVSVLLPRIAGVLLGALVISLVVYGLVRAIGWVIGGFTA